MIKFPSVFAMRITSGQQYLVLCSHCSSLGWIMLISRVFFYSALGQNLYFITLTHSGIDCV